MGPIFEQLWGWVESQNVPVQRTIGIYYDDPEQVAPNLLRSAAAVEVPLDYILTNTVGRPIVLGQIAGGDYANCRFVGPYEELGPVWAELMRAVTEDLKREISENPAFEVYVNDASSTPPEQLITELYMPLV